MMNNIDKLAIEQMIYEHTGFNPNVADDAETIKHIKNLLEAFAKALQSSEPVAKPYLYLRLKNGEPDWSDDCVSEDYSALTEDGSMDDGIYSALPLFTFPPSTISLEKRIAELEAKWCKDGETIEQRLERERSDVGSTILLLAKERAKVHALQATNKKLLDAINLTIEENGYLADGDNCTLRHLVKAIADAEGVKG